MIEADRQDFVAALRCVFETYSKPLPTKPITEMWWKTLMPFPAEVIADAFEQHIGASGYVPVPSDIRALCIQARKHQVDESAARLTYTPERDSELVERGLETLRAIVTPLTNRPGVEWAFKLLDRGTSASGAPLTDEVARAAGDAVLSAAGRQLIEGVRDDDLRRRYRAIYRAVEKQRREAP
ncbi:hypothetical protein [Burkholderia sp. LMG 21824]|uniref:hypothetical protein n=1 Tax=Burkholderia sp. LMG 21824 TaxID=3158172 RepID=UPI003C2B4772